MRTAANPSEPEARRALSTLCDSYWYPLYPFVRRRGCGPDDARDLTQAFFVRLLEKNTIARAVRGRGRFRTFLLASLKNFLSDEWDRNRAQKRMPKPRLFSWDAEAAEQRYLRELADRRTPEDIFQRNWVLEVLERAAGRLHQECAEKGKSPLLERLPIFLSGDKGRVGYRETATELGISEEALKSSVHRLRRRFRELVREELRETVTDPAQLQDELRFFSRALRG